MPEVKPYSQGHEEEVITHFFKGKLGRFLDIGAWDGVIFSNTLKLAELGWDGIMVEPSPNALACLLRNHRDKKNIKIVGAFIGKGKFTKFYDATGDGVSTVNVPHRDKWAAAGTTFSEMYVPVVTVDGFLSEFPGPYHFISIDTEKTSFEIFYEIDFNRTETQMVAVERDDHEKELVAYARDKFGFGLSFVDGNNIIFSR